MLREKPEDEEWLQLREVKLPILLNFAQVKLSKKEYYEVIEHTTEVLQAKPGTIDRAGAAVGDTLSSRIILENEKIFTDYIQL